MDFLGHRVHRGRCDLLRLGIAGEVQKRTIGLVHFLLVLGGMVSSLIHVLIVTPVIFTWLRERELGRERIH